MERGFVGSVECCGHDHATGVDDAFKFCVITNGRASGAPGFSGLADARRALSRHAFVLRLVLLIEAFRDGEVLRSSVGFNTGADTGCSPCWQTPPVPVSQPGLQMRD
jgi:hypothetical protein